MSSFDLKQIMIDLVAQTPQLLVYLGGIFLCFLFYKRREKSAIISIVALSILTISIFVTPLMWRIIIQSYTGNGIPSSSGGMSSLQVALFSFRVLASLKSALCIGLLIWAVFAGVHSEEQH